MHKSRSVLRAFAGCSSRCCKRTQTSAWQQGHSTNGRIFVAWKSRVLVRVHGQERGPLIPWKPFDPTLLRRRRTTPSPTRPLNIPQVMSSQARDARTPVLEGEAMGPAYGALSDGPLPAPTRPELPNGVPTQPVRAEEGARQERAIGAVSGDAGMGSRVGTHTLVLPRTSCLLWAPWLPSLTSTSDAHH